MEVYHEIAVESAYDKQCRKDGERLQEHRTRRVEDNQVDIEASDGRYQSLVCLGFGESPAASMASNYRLNAVRLALPLCQAEHT